MGWEAFVPKGRNSSLRAGTATINRGGQLRLAVADLEVAEILGAEVAVEIDHEERRISLRSPTGWRGRTMKLQNLKGSPYLNATGVLSSLGLTIEECLGERRTLVHEGRLIVLLPKPAPRPQRATPIKGGGA